MDDLVDEYQNDKILQEHKVVVDKIRKSLKLNPRVIVLTKDCKEYSIYDGWHTALAFILGKRDIHAYFRYLKKN